MRGVPAAFIADTYTIGDAAIKTKLENKLKECIQAGGCALGCGA